MESEKGSKNRKKYLPRLATENGIGSFCLSNRVQVVMPPASRRRALRDGDHYS